MRSYQKPSLCASAVHIFSPRADQIRPPIHLNSSFTQRPRIVFDVQIKMASMGFDWAKNLNKNQPKHKKQSDMAAVVATTTTTTTTNSKHNDDDNDNAHKKTKLVSLQPNSADVINSNNDKNNNKKRTITPLPSASALAPVFVPNSKGPGGHTKPPQVQQPSSSSSCSTPSSPCFATGTDDDGTRHPGPRPCPYSYDDNDSVGSWTDDDIFMPKTFLPRRKPTAYK